jgi:tetratricopeptide (TPR) repeat protein
VFRLLALLLFTTSVPALAECAAYVDGVNAYNRGDYGTAIKLFNTAISSAESKNANAHYYLAGAYFRLDNKQAALDEYRLSLKLAPQGQSARFCKQAIDHISSSSGSRPIKTEVEKISGGSATTVDKKSKSFPIIKISGLPAIPQAVKDDGPALPEILLWPLNQQSAYYLIAFNRKNAALARLDQLSEILKRAESLASSAVPNARGYGESEAETRKRVENGRAQLMTILEPYKSAVEAAQRSVEQANSIYETCLSAGRRLSGY